MTKSTWFKPKKYPHFDWPIANPKRFLARVASPSNVAKWAFYPFMQFTIITRKYSRRDKTSREKSRSILYASHSDSTLYAYYASKLAPKYEEIISQLGISENILAYRKINNKCNIDFALRAFKEISSRAECYALAFDIEKFFDKIDHNFLKSQLCYVLGQTHLPDDYYNIFKSLTKFSYIEKASVLNLLGLSKNGHHPKRLCPPKDFRSILRNSICTNKENYGIPQGSPLSGLLANISLLHFDIKLAYEAKRRHAAYYRYSDDILLICRPSDSTFFMEFTESALNEINLETNKKTKQHHFSTQSSHLISDTPLQYLGFMFDGENIYLRSSSIIRYQARLNKKISDLKRSRDKHNIIRQSNGLAPRPLFLKTLLARNTHLGKRNFIRYGLRAARIMNSSSIKHQLSRLNKQFTKQIAQ